MTKSKNKPTINIIGNCGDEVTGSIIQVLTSKGTSILLDCGYTQGGTVAEDYRANHNAFNQIDLGEVKYCFLLHQHGDHIFGTPRAVSLGMKAKIITNPISAKIMKPMLFDCAFINRANSITLTKQVKKDISPLFVEDDVYDMLNNTYEYEFGEIHKLDEEISFRLLKNSHIIGASSLELFMKDDSGHQYKLFYSSDLGNTAIPNRPYLSEMEYCRNANISIFESTYGDREEQITKKDRKLEEKLLKDKIVEYCLGKQGNVLIPTFSLARSQEVMTILYDLFKDDERFNKVDFIVDSSLTKKVTKVYTEILENEELERFNNVLTWKNLKMITDFNKETTVVLRDKSPKVIISSSGFGDNGHAKEYIKQYITKKNACLIFCGYASENSLSGKLRKETRSINIDKKPYEKNAEILVLKSFSSHMQKNQLVDYICQINTEKVILVHGSKEAKESLKNSCEEKLSQMNKTTNIIVGKKNMKISI